MQHLFYFYCLLNSRAGQNSKYPIWCRLQENEGHSFLSSDQPETDSYFDTGKFRFHGPDGSEADYAALTNYFESIRAAFDERSIRRGIVVAEGDYVACQTWIEGRFVREFTHSPARPVPPNGQRVVWDLLNIFRFDDQARLVEEWVRTDYRSFLRQLGAQGQ
jgi:predicted ester cyclase